MIKLNWIYLLIFSLGIYSCSSDDVIDDKDPVNPPSPPSMSQKAEINDFIYKGMNFWYYWKDEVPVLADNRFSSNNDYSIFLNENEPENLFYTLLYDYQKVDRFSWIVDDVDELLKSFSGVSKSSGMDLSLAYLDQNQGTVLALVNYVAHDSPADKQGVERGDLIIAVNGSQLTDKNYTALFSDSFNATLGKRPSIQNGGITIEGQAEVRINAVELEENPVHYKQVYNVGDKKVGYLVYNGYKAVYNDELNAAFGEFKNAGVTDLILDLRYNGGGSLSSAVGLSQMITGQFTNSPFVSLEFNKNLSSENVMYKLENEISIYDFVNGQTKLVGTEPINSLYLNKVYVLTSGATASASELTVVGLSDYINVTLIGSTTYGKFVGSTTLYDSPEEDYLSYEKRNKSHNYAMQPIIFSYFNSSHQTYTQGLEPDFMFGLDSYIGMRDFGEVEDAAFSKALNLITGQSFRKSQSERLSNEPRFIGTSKTLQKFGTELYIDPGMLQQ
ncbi:MAG: S41 family peptidase [Weeksellaceae bacterium]